jgi:hypothetical protein
VFSDETTSHLLSVWEDDSPNDMLFQQDEAHPHFHIADSESNILTGIDWRWWRELKLEPMRIKLEQVRIK